jgi:hypothetical protein
VIPGDAIWLTLVLALLICAAAGQQPQPGGDDSLYEIRDDGLIRTSDGAKLSATVVSDESIADAREPLQIRWHTDSYLNLPLDE